MVVESATPYIFLDEKGPQYAFEEKDPIKPVEHLFIKWTINDFSKLQNFPPQTITSPPVQINFTSDSWLIDVFTDFLFTSERKIIQFRLIRKASKDESTVTVSYRFGLKKSDITWFEPKSNVSYPCNGTSLAFCVIPEYFGKENVLIDNKLIVMCEMYVTYKLEDKLCLRGVNEMYFDLSVLSLDLFNLSKKTETSDVIVQVKDLSNPVHKAILAVRSSIFSEMLSNSESCIKISDDDYDHFTNILLYIYTANFYWINFNGIDIGLYECAERFNVQGLIQLLTPVHIDVRSSIMEETINFTWEIDNFSKLNLKLDECITSPPFCAGSTDAPVWNLDIYPDGCHRDPNNVGIYLRTKDEHIFSHLNINIAILNEFKHELYTRSIDKTLYPNFLYGCPEYVSKKCLQEILCDDKLIINCKIKNLSYANSCDRISSVSHEEFACFDLLSTDMENLLSSKKFSDCTLITANGTKFFVHKAILSARSTVFEFIIKESEKDNYVIRINDVCPNVLKEILYFCYTAKNKFYNVTFCMKLYEGAKTYKIKTLLRKCIYNLLLSVDEKSVCEVIAFSYKHEERTLLTRCLIYLKMTRDTALNSTEWQNFAETEEVLACKIFQWLKTPPDFSLCLWDFYEIKKM